MSKAKPLNKAVKAIVIVFIVIAVIVTIIVGLMLSTYIPRGYRTDWTAEAVTANPHIVNDGAANAEGTSKTLVCAHRAGRTLAPENTIAAFAKCFDNVAAYGYRFDTLEFDLHLTKDGHLILLHDDTLDRTSDCTLRGEKDVHPKDKTLAELKTYNMGYNFPDPEAPGHYPYRDMTDEQLDAAHARICTLEEVLDYVNSRLAEGQTMNYIIEIKDDGDRGHLATDKLYQTMLDYHILDKVIVGTFHQAVTSYIDTRYQNREDGKNIIRSASISEVLDFYFSMMFNVDLSKKKVGYSVLQIPYRDFVINLGKPAIIEYAHAFGIAVQYWTINDAADMQYLADAGADTIMTDDPALLYKTIKTK
ncbi:MAG: hypothetical protein II896_06135 [Clostridia bacterium]|nr:hypothetical protein [Clostridia bacterium]